MTELDCGCQATREISILLLTISETGPSCSTHFVGQWVAQPEPNYLRVARENGDLARLISEDNRRWSVKA